MSLSQADRILLVLLDGGWHSTSEILREVPSIVHSRISDLRAAGLKIEHRTTGVGAAGSEYRLLGSPAGRATETAAVVAAPGDPNSGPLSRGEPGRASVGAGRLQESPAVPPSDARPLASSPLLSGASAQAVRPGEPHPNPSSGVESGSPSHDSLASQLPLFGRAA